MDYMTSEIANPNPAPLRPQTDIELPARMRHLPRDHRGFVIPYFVAWLDETSERELPIGQGRPDFRVMSAERHRRCKRDKLCWVCGQKLGRYLVFTIGPMCAITRTTMEPPAHYECANYSARVCPFLSRPKMVRNEKDMPEGYWAPGLTIARNPGVMALWVCRTWQDFKVDGSGGGNAGVLIRVGEPDRVEWWARGRPATREEVQESIDTGLPALRTVADKEGKQARRELEEQFVPRIAKLLPA